MTDDQMQPHTSAHLPQSGAQAPVKPKGFLEEEPGRKSTMRAMSIIALIASITFGLITLLAKGANSESGIFITFGFLLAAFAPKALQKFAETKIPPSGPTG